MENEVLTELVKRVRSLELQAEMNKERVTSLERDITDNATELRETKNSIHSVERRLDDFNTRIFDEMYKIHSTIGSIKDDVQCGIGNIGDKVNDFKLEIKAEFSSVKQDSMVSGLKGSAAIAMMLGIFTLMLPGVINTVMPYFNSQSQSSKSSTSIEKPVDRGVRHR